MKLSENIVKKVSLLLSMIMTMNSSSIVSITAAEKSVSAAEGGYADIISKASAYLGTRVNADNSIGEGSIINEASEKWLTEKADQGNTDITARIAAYTGDGNYLSKLETKQGTDGGFGLYPEYTSDVIDTVLVLDALNETGYSGDNIDPDGLCNYLVKAVNTDGGYSWAAYNKSEPLLTSIAVSDIGRYCKANGKSIEPFKASVSFVEKIGDSYEDSGIQNTICKYLALEAAGKEPDMDTVMAELQKVQKADGSFADSIETTYYAVRLAKAAGTHTSGNQAETTAPAVTATAKTTAAETTKVTAATATAASTAETTEAASTDTTTAAVSETTGPAGADGILLGDVNFDGIIDGRDATDVLTDYAKTSTGHETKYNEEQKTAADVNRDNIIDGRDATIILTYYAYISTGHDMTLEDFIMKQS